MEQELAGNVSAQLELATAAAIAEFPKDGTAQDVAKWWAKWYLQAGHKRLGRFLAQTGKSIA